MSRAAGERIAAALGGVGGAPGQAGHQYVVGLPEDLSALTARAAVLLASADVVLVDSDVTHPALRIAEGAAVRQRRLGEPLRYDAGVVVRVVDHLPLHEVAGLVDELAALDRAGVPFEVEPLPDSPGVPTIVRAWQGRLPLRGMRVLVPRTRRQASELSMHIRSLGGEPIEAPTIDIAPGDHDRLVRACHDLAGGAYRAVCLTSPNGVAAFADALDEAGLDARALAHVRTVACVGPGTAHALWDRLHVGADVVPATATTAALAEALPRGSGRVLLPRADIATNDLVAGLTAQGYEPHEVAAYRTTLPARLPEPVMADLAADRIDLLAFASSSSVRNFVLLMGEEPWSGDVVSIGPVTTRTADELGVTVAIEARPHTIPGLVAALCRAAAARR